MKAILSSRAYGSGNTAIFVTWDEDAKFENTLCPRLGCDHIATLVVSPSVPPGTRSSVVYSHYSLLRATEDMLGLRSHLGKAASAQSLAPAFHLLGAGR
jgi:hypothetical protein